MPDNSSKFSNFFTLFDLPISFDIDESKLSNRLRQLQSQYHPDKLAKDSTAPSESNLTSATNLQSNNGNQSNQDNQFDDKNSIAGLSQQNSAVINHAYNILKNPDSRANYLLELSGQNLNTDDSIADIEFLDDAMDIRMDLDDAEASADLAKIKSLKSNVDQRTVSQSQRFKEAYTNEDWSTAMDATQKLKFLVKLKKDMDIAIDNSQNQDNDDDLYL